MKFIYILALAIIALILQSTLFSFLQVAGVKPDLTLILILFIAFFFGAQEGALVGFGVGFLQDLLLGKFLGMNALVKMVTGFIIGSLETKFYKENLIIPTFILFIGTLLNESLFFLIGKVFGLEMPWESAVKNIILPTAIYNCALAPFLYGQFFKSASKGVLSNRN